MKRLREILLNYKSGVVELDEVVELLKKWPYENLSYAKVDHHRAIRRGFPEVVYGEGKPPEQIVGILRSMEPWDHAVLVTRVSPEVARVVLHELPHLDYHRVPRLLTHVPKTTQPPCGSVHVLTAGTSDIPVAEEAAVTAEVFGCPVERFYDVGVAGLHRLLDVWSHLESASVHVVVAGMEGALPSVVAGLVASPVIAVPTSVGYGTAFGGVTALCAMLNCCAPGVAVVNIDNGFGAGYLASMIATGSAPTEPRQVTEQERGSHGS